MAKKTLLSEGQVRHFMKLASITPLAETFLSEMEDLTEEEVVEETADPLTEENAEDAMYNAADEAEKAEGEAAAAEEDAAELGAEERGDALDMLGRALSALTGEDVVVSGGAEEVVADVDVDVDVDEEAVEEGGDRLGDQPDTHLDYMKTEDADMYEELNENVKVVDDEKIVKEVAARVAKRLLEESRQDQLAESLAKRIAEKLR